MPDGHHIGMVQRMRFPLRGHEPQISILIRVDNDAATDDFIVAEGDKDLTYGTTLKTEAERLRGDVTVEFEPVVVLKHLPEGSDLIIGSASRVTMPAVYPLSIVRRSCSDSRSSGDML